MATIIRNYGILSSIQNSIREGKYFRVEEYLEYCSSCRWHRTPFCTCAGGKSKRFTARCISNTEGREEIFVFMMGEPVLGALIPVPFAEFVAARISGP